MLWSPSSIRCKTAAMRTAAFLLFFFLWTVPSYADDAPTATDADFASLNKALVDKLVIPLSVQYETAAWDLISATDGFCAKPNGDDYATLMTFYNGAMEAWQAFQPIGFGPLAPLAERIEFWPDSKTATERQLRAALNKKDETLLAPNGLDGKSVALQSLATFEILLAGNAQRLSEGHGKPEDQYACKLMVAIAKLQANLASAVRAGWSQVGGYAEQVAKAGTAESDYPDARAVANDFLKAMVNSLDVMVRNKLERPMGTDIAKARGNRAESAPTGRARANIIANLITVRDLYGIQGSFADLLNKVGEGPLADSTGVLFNQAVDEIRALDAPLQKAIADTVMRPKLESFVRDLKALRKLLGGPLAEPLGLAVGFNALDGD